MTKTINLSIAEAEIAMEAIASYCKEMGANEDNKWLADGAAPILSNIINQLEQADEKAQSYGVITARVSSHLTPSELSNYILADVAITLINENTGEKSVVEVDSFDLSNIEWIDGDKNEEEANNVEELNKKAEGEFKNLSVEDLVLHLEDVLHLIRVNLKIEDLENLTQNQKGLLVDLGLLKLLNDLHYELASDKESDFNSKEIINND